MQSENARLVRCVRAWLDDNQRCECDFPEFEEDGIIYCAACELRSYMTEPPLPKHKERFAALAAKETENG
jgi:uncharacterized Zn finger protein (UPF0148 family)